MTEVFLTHFYLKVDLIPVSYTSNVGINALFLDKDKLGGGHEGRCTLE